MLNQGCCHTGLTTTAEFTSNIHAYATYMHVACSYSVPLQANVDSQLPPQEWPLEALAVKLKQYCYLLDDLTAQVLEEQAGKDYELLRDYLRRRAVDAFWQKVQPPVFLKKQTPGLFLFELPAAHVLMSINLPLLSLGLIRGAAAVRLPPSSQHVAC